MRRHGGGDGDGDGDGDHDECCVSREEMVQGRRATTTGRYYVERDGWTESRFGYKAKRMSGM